MYLTFRLSEKKQYVKRKKGQSDLQAGSGQVTGSFDEETSSL
jgi:hypothetical protein